MLSIFYMQRKITDIFSIKKMSFSDEAKEYKYFTFVGNCAIIYCR